MNECIATLPPGLHGNDHPSAYPKVKRDLPDGDVAGEDSAQVIDILDVVAIGEPAARPFRVEHSFVDPDEAQTVHGQQQSLINNLSKRGTDPTERSASTRLTLPQPFNV